MFQLDEEVKPEVVFKEEPESSDGIGDDGDFDPENGGDSDYEPERKSRKRSAAIVRKPKTEMQNVTVI